MVSKIILLATLTSSGSTAMPSDLDALIRAHGFQVPEGASSLVQLPDRRYVLRVNEANAVHRQALVVVGRGKLDVLEIMEYPGDAMKISVVDLNADGKSDLLIEESYEIGGSESYWFIRIFLGGERFQRAFVGRSSSPPELRDIDRDGILELLTTSNPYGSDLRSAMCPKLHVLRGNAYEEAPKQ